MDGIRCLTLSDYVDKKRVRQLHREAIYGVFNHQCAYCGAKAESLDHVKSKHKGGQNLSTNLVPACLQCNRDKGSTDVWEFFNENQDFYCESRAAFIRQWMSGEITALQLLSTEELGHHSGGFYVSFG